MSETVEAPVQTQEQQPNQETVANSGFNPFKNESWVADTAPIAQTISIIPQVAETIATPTPPPTVETPATPTPPVAEEEIVDIADLMKTHFGAETLEEAANTYKQLKAEKEKGFEFSNDDSRKVFEYIKEGKEDELFSVLDQKRKVSKLLTAEKVDDSIAAQMIKMGMQAKYKDLTPEEIDYKFNKQFSIPAKPVQDTINESDEDYAAKLSNWEARVNEVKMDMIIEAKLAKPELEKLKTELILPDIKRNDPSNNEPSAEVLAAAQKAREKFLTSLNSDFSKFNGYETKVKDGSVEIPVSFIVPEEERVAQRTKIEGIEDIVQYFNQRWFDANDNLNAQKIMADLYLLENPEKVFQGIANNAASQRLVEHIKQSSNIKLDTVNPSPTTTEVVQEGGMSIDQQVAALWKQKY